MNVMQKFTLKSLALNKRRTVVTIIGVIISAAMMTAVATFLTSFIDMLRCDSITTNGNWHAMIGNVATADIRTITGSAEIGEAFLSRKMGYGMLEGSQDYQKPYLYVVEYDPSAFTGMSVRLTSGRLPEKSGEIVLSESIEKSCGVKYDLGDTIMIDLGKRINTENGEEIEDNTSLYVNYNETGGEQTISESLDQQKTATYTVVGFITRPGIEYSWSAGCAAIGYLDESALKPDDTVDIYFTMAKPSRSIFGRVPEIAETIGKTASDTDINVGLLRYYGLVQDDNLYGFLMGFAAVIIIIIIIASVTLIYNAFAISVSERSKQLGLLASVGATRKQKRSSVMFEGFIIGAIGIPLGILAGIGGMAVTLKAIQPLLGDFLTQIKGVKLALVVSPLFLALAFVFSVITIFISAYIPAMRASRITPVEAIRQTKEVHLTRRKVRTPWYIRNLFGFEAEIALKNLKRSRKKYRATILSLIISIVLFLTVTTYARMTNIISGASYDGYNYDISINYPTLTTGQQIASTNDTIKSLDQVDDYTTIRKVTGSVKIDPDHLSDNADYYVSAEPDENGDIDYEICIIALDDESFENYLKAVGVSGSKYDDPAHPSGILINYAQGYIYDSNGHAVKSAGKIMDISPGEVLRVGVYDYNDGSYDSPVDLSVAASTEERPMGIAIQEYYRVNIVVSNIVFDSIISSMSTGQRSGIENAIYLTAGDDQALEKQLMEIAQPFSSMYLRNINSAAREERNFQMFVEVFIYGFLTLISLICIANIFNTVTTNIALRRKEFAMLRSVGMTPGGFNKMVRFESIFYGLKGLLYGLPISAGIGILLYYMQQSALASPFDLPWGSYLVAIIMILVIVFATMLYSTSKIKRENIIDALKEENM